MNFRTPVRVAKRASLSLGSEVVSLGSCFADRIGQRLTDALFCSVVNPTGIAYNPHSLGTSLSAPKRPRLFLHQGLWRSLQHHSRLAHAESKKALQGIERAEAVLQQGLKKASLLILTLGTAQVFELINSQKIVANCHRLESSLFNRRRLSLEESLEKLQDPILCWLEQAQDRRVLLTVSPVRYAKEGLVESQRSKAVLHLTCEALTQVSQRIEYFPAYEIVIDELRDYRFFAQDMLHPSQQAVDYVWERFKETYFESKDMTTLKKIEDLQKLAAHRVSPGSSAKSVASRGLQMIAEVRSLCPGLRLGSLEKHFRDL